MLPAVLIVDDDDDYLEIASRALRQERLLDRLGNALAFESQRLAHGGISSPFSLPRPLVLSARALPVRAEAASRGERVLARERLVYPRRRARSRDPAEAPSL